jgi:GAF domain-containing protein
MSEAPDPATILDIVSSFDQDTSPDAFLAKSVSAIPARIDQARFARVYRLHDGKAVLQAASDTEQPTGAYRYVRGTPVYAEVVRHGTPAVENGLWVGPLHFGPTIYGLLEIGASDDLTRAWSSALRLLAQHLGQSLYTVTIHDLVRRQASAAMELTRCTTFTEIAGAIGRHMLQGGQFVTIDLLEYGENGAMAGLRVLASANRQQTFDAAETLPLSINDLGQPLAESFINAQPALVNDISGNNTMSVPFRKWLAGHKVEALLSLPLRRGEQTLGVLVINSIEGPLLLTDDQMMAYRSLADQVSALVQVHRLTEESARSQDISERQARAFAELRSSQDFAEMAGIMARHMLPTPGRFLTINSLQYDSHGQMNGLRMLASANRERTYTYEAAELPFGWEGTSARVRQMLRDGVMQVSEMQLESPESLGVELYAWLEANKVKHFMTFPMSVSGRPVAVLSVLSKSTPFSKDEINAFHNLADQVGALFHTRDLLRQTEDTLVQVQILYEVNRSILAAQDALDVLRALRDHLAPDASTISHIVVGYNAKNRIETLTVSHLLAAGREEVVDIPFHEMIGPEKVAALQVYWEQQGARLSVIEDIHQSDYPLQEFIEGQNTQSYLAITVPERGQIKHLIGISFDHPRTFDELTRRLYESLSDQISIVFQNLRLLQESQVSAAELGKQVEVLEHINQLATTLSAIQGEASLFARSAEMLVNTVKADHCGMVLVDPGEETGTVVGEYPLGTAMGLRIPWTGNPLAALVTHEGKTAIVHDVASDARLIEATRLFFESAGITACIFVPLKMQGKVVGSVGLDIYNYSHSISPEMVEIAEIMTTQIGVALQNVRLLTDTQRHAQQLQRIAAFNQSVQATLDMEAIFNIALTESAQMLPLDQMYILLYDPGQGQLRTVAEYEQGQIKITLTDGALLGLDDTTEGRVWRTREFVYLPTESRARDPRQPFKMEPGSDMIAALQSHGRTLGVVSVSSSKTYAYGETDFAVFRQMTDQLTVAIENAEAYTQSQRQARNEALVNDIATRLQRQTDIQSMLDITMNELGKALGARRARIRLATQPGEPHEKPV